MSGHHPAGAMTLTPTTDLPARQHPWALALFCWASYAVLVASSILWLDDWGRYGPGYAAGFGAGQARAVSLALVASLVLWCLRDRLLHALLRWLATGSGMRPAQRWRRVLLWLGAFVLVVAALHWAHRVHAMAGLPAGLRPSLAAATRWAVDQHLLPVRAALTVELLRLPACLMLAWCLYRWRHAGLPFAGNLLLALAVTVALALGLWVSEDKGPMLVVTMAGVLLCAGTVASLVANRTQFRWWGGLLGLALAVAGMGLLLALLPHLAPADRVIAWRQPYVSRLEYLAQITWFLQAAGLGGFGLGQTPWCGYAGAVLGRCQGMPVETQSDFTLAALAGLWGPAAAWAVAALCALWLGAMLKLAARAPRPQHGIDAPGLAASAGALYALMLLAQLMVTCLGNVGVLPLTGVTFPLLSWGRASLLGATLAMAMVMPGWPARQGRSVHSGLGTGAGPWGAVSSLAMWGACAGLAGTAWGLVQRLQDTPPAQLAKGRANPWLPLPGCLRSGAGLPLAGLPLAPGVQTAVCDGAEATAISASLPDDSPLRLALLQAANRQPLAVPLAQRGLRIPRRADLATTLDGALQMQSDQLTRCLVGASDTACSDLIPAPLRQHFAQRHEGAAVRSVSTVTLRLRDGALLATTHARSACSQAQMDNRPRPTHCPPEAARALPRAGRQSQQGLRANDMVASTLKPWLADGMLTAPGGQRWLAGAARQQMLQALAVSDTAFFIDHLLCFAPGGQPGACTGPAVLAKRAMALGLARPINLLARPAGTPALPRLLLTGLPLDLPLWPPVGPRADAEMAAARRCFDRPADQRWRTCEGEQLAALVAPLWGQGGARSHPLAVAHLYLKLVAAARGQADVPAPHLLAGGGEPGPVGFPQAHADLILEGLRRSPLVGTGRGACASARGPAACNGLGLAMKTGTSLFPHHGMTVAQRAQHCLAAFSTEDASRLSGQPLPALVAREALYCALYPMKWAVLIEAERPGADALLTVVLVERNTHRDTGRLDAGDDRGPNAAAEAALLLHGHRLAAPKPSRQ